MQVILDNVDSSFLQVLRSFKAIMPNLEITTKEGGWPEDYSDVRTKEQIKAEMDEAIVRYKAGETEGFFDADGAKNILGVK